MKKKPMKKKAKSPAKKARKPLSRSRSRSLGASRSKSRATSYRKRGRRRLNGRITKSQLKDLTISMLTGVAGAIPLKMLADQIQTANELDDNKRLMLDAGVTAVPLLVAWKVPKLAKYLVPVAGTYGAITVYNLVEKKVTEYLDNKKELNGGATFRKPLSASANFRQPGSMNGPANLKKVNVNPLQNAGQFGNVNPFSHVANF